MILTWSSNEGVAKSANSSPATVTRSMAGVIRSVLQTFVVRSFIS